MENHQKKTSIDTSIKIRITVFNQHQ